MRGSLPQAAAPGPKPLELAGRALLCTVLVLAVLQVCSRPLAQALLPGLRAVVPLLDPRFQLSEVRLARHGADEVVRFRGNLSRPLLVQGRIVSPFGWNGTPPGGFQITYTLGGVLQYSAGLLIFTLAWPVSGRRELARRLALALPCIALLPLAIVPLTVVAEFRHGLMSLVAPGPPGGLLIASRYLMGGGGWAIVLVAAALCIDRARLIDRQSNPR